MSGIVSIDYSEMNKAAKEAREAAKKCTEYGENIDKKISRKLSSLTLGPSGNTMQADYFAKLKINDLEQKREKYEKYAQKVENANIYAGETDEKVSRYIKNASNAFRESHNMKVNVITEFFAWTTTTLLNKTAFGRWLNQISGNVSSWLDTAKRAFKNWYELDGGKYIVKVALAAIGTVIAVIVLVCVALPALVAVVSAIAASGIAGLTGAAVWTLITAAAGFVTAVVAVADGIVKTVNSSKAVLAFQDDPGWAKRYSSFTSLSQYLRENNFDALFLNKISGIAANIVDSITIAAALINFADLIHNGINVVQKLKNGGMVKVFNKVHFKSPSGKVTVGTIKHGIKNIIRNTGELKKLITATNVARLQTYYEKQSQVYNFYKTLKSGNKILKLADSWAEKGTLSLVKEKIKEKVKDKITSQSTTYEYASKIKEIVEKIKKMKKANEPAYNVG